MSKISNIVILIILPILVVLFIRHHMYCIEDCYLYNSDGIKIERYITKTLDDGKVINVPNHESVKYCIDKTTGEQVSYLSDTFILFFYHT